MRFLCFLFLCLRTQIGCFAQSILNGDFEINTASADVMSYPNTTYNSYMAYSTAFGTADQIDILTSDHCGLAQHGNWYLGLAYKSLSGNTDALSLELSNELVCGNIYTITYHDRGCTEGSTGIVALDIGVSPSSNNFGTLVFQGTLPIDSVWSEKSFSFIAPTNGLYITIRAAIGSFTSDWIHVDNFTLTPEFEVLGNDTSICVDSLLRLNPSIVNAQYLWSNNSTGADLSISESGVYWIQVTSNGCTFGDTLNVTVENCNPILLIPNIITPNGDGLNDVFEVQNFPENAVIIIYNRWGVLLFESNTPDNFWDGRTKSGTLVPGGVYYYIINLPNGKKAKGFIEVLI